MPAEVPVLLPDPPALDAICQYTSGLADEPCRKAVVRACSKDSIELLSEYRFEVGATLAIDVLERDTGRVRPTRFVQISKVEPTADRRWQVFCQAREGASAKRLERERVLPMERSAPLPQAVWQLTRPGPICPFPFRRAISSSGGWASFLVLLLYLANQRRIGNDAELWNLSNIGFLLAFGAGFGIVSVALGWAMDRASRWAERRLGLR